MNFASDNCGPVHPEIMQALAEANSGYQRSYGDDALMGKVRDQIRELFEAPDAAVYLVATGTAANSLALATLAQPWQTIFCPPLAHIHTDECQAPEFYSGGSKLSLVGEGDRLDPDELRKAINAWVKGDVHVSQRGPVAMTQLTEMGQCYTLDEIQRVTDVAREFDLPVYMDGARFSNAVVALDCTPAEMTWKAGVDAVSMGGTKNGCMGVEAVIFFNPDKASEFELRRKRGAHLFSKHRYLSAQMHAYLSNDLWRTSAMAANARATELANGLMQAQGIEFLAEPQANMIFARLPRATHQRLHSSGAVYGLIDGPLASGDPSEPLAMRLVCDWSTTSDSIRNFVQIACEQ